MAFRFGHLEWFTADPAMAARFYVDALGFTLIAEQGPDFTWIGLGEVEILLRRGTPPATGDTYASAGTALVLYTDDVAGAVERLSARGVVVRGDDGPANPAIRDPDGRWIQLANPD
jgi:catechol 2,3-dioxygenase-like lactoylglutathione lyase family enzyme